MVNEDGIVELRKRSSRMAAVRRYSRHAELHRRRAEGGGSALPALPLAAMNEKTREKTIKRTEHMREKSSVPEQDERKPTET